MQNESAAQPVPRPAATVMAVKDAPGGIVVLMARRSANSAFMPDAYVFPGGAMERGDETERAVARLDRAPAGVDAPFAVAALRELFEEAGVLLAVDRGGTPPSPAVLAVARAELREGATFAAVLERRGWTLCGSALTYYSRWITPPGDVKRRFDTRFFIGEAHGAHVVAADTVEMHDGVWISPADALRRGERREWNLVFPTIRHLERLARFSSVAALAAHARRRRPVAVMPEVGADGTIAMPADVQEW